MKFQTSGLLFISSFLFLVFFFSCSAPKLEFKESQITPKKIDQAKRVFSQDSSIIIKMPSGWYITKISDNRRNITIIKDDNNFVISIEEININSDIKKSEIEEKLLTLAKLSLGQKIRKFGKELKVIGSPDLFFISDKKYSEYQFRFGQEQIGRVIVYNIKDRFFEIFAFSTEKLKKQETKDIDDLFALQQFVLESLFMK